MLVEGLIMGTVANLIDENDWLQNLSEWHFTTALTFYPVLVWYLWRQTGFTVVFQIGSGMDAQAESRPKEV